MKRFVFAILCLMCVLSLFVCAKITDEQVEIRFTVGQDSIFINNQETKVEKPYIVGEGTTLVPVRVISEAFGIEVGWDSSEKKIFLYTEGKMGECLELWIGRKTVSIMSWEAEVLPEAPELKNSTSMVPLRFICEAFGANVSYNPETKEITVIKPTKDKVDETNNSKTYGNYDAALEYGVKLLENHFPNLYTEHDSSEYILVLDAVDYLNWWLVYSKPRYIDPDPYDDIKYVTYGGGNFVIFDKGNGAVLRFGESE